MPRRAGDAELLAPVKSGGTLLDVMWEDLLNCIDDLMKAGELEWSDEDRIRCQGRAEGVAWCIAVLTQSPRPINITAIKDEAMQKWELMQLG